MLRCYSDAWGLLYGACGTVGQYTLDHMNESQLKLYLKHRCHTIEQVIFGLDAQTCVEYVNACEQQLAALEIRKATLPVLMVTLGLKFGDAQHLLSLFIVLWFVKNM